MLRLNVIITAYCRLKMLSPLCHILSVSQKLHVTQALVLSLFDYVDVVYISCLSKYLLRKIQLIQNSCLRFSYGIRKYDHISPSFQHSGWLTIHQRFIVHLCCLTYKILQSNTPIYLRELLQYDFDSHFNPYSQLPVININFPVLLIAKKNFKTLSLTLLQSSLIAFRSLYVPFSLTPLLS